MACGLSEVLWAYRNSKSKATGLTSYELMYGQDVVLPLELAANSLIVCIINTVKD